MNICLDIHPTQLECFLITPSVQAAELTPWLLSIEGFRTRECVIGRSFEEVVKSTLDNIKLLNNQVTPVRSQFLTFSTRDYPEKEVLYRVQDGVGQIMVNPGYVSHGGIDPIWWSVDLDNITEEIQNEIYTAYATEQASDIEKYVRLQQELVKENPTTCFRTIGYHKVYISTRTDSSMLLDLTI